MSLVNGDFSVSHDAPALDFNETVFSVLIEKLKVKQNMEKLMVQDPFSWPRQERRKSKISLVSFLLYLEHSVACSCLAHYLN